MTSEEKNIKSDYDYSRDTYYDLIEKGRESLEDMIEVARQSEHPRAYEVLSGMIKNISDVNDKLMDLNKKNKDINQENVKQIAGNTTNNVFYITQPFPSWTLNNTSWEWEAPITEPTLTDQQQKDGKYYSWDEDTYQADNTKGWVLKE